MDNPGWHKLNISPQPLTNLKHFRAEYRGYISEWNHNEENIEFKLTVPENAVANYKLPGIETQTLKTGLYQFSL